MAELLIREAKTGADRDICLRLRHAVFVEEQGVPLELEIDAHDRADAIHFLGSIDGQPAAAARICVFGNTAKIQRVVILRPYRGAGHGRTLMLALMKHIRQNRLGEVIALDAQTYAVKFYESLGFKATGDEFDDAGIPHIRMVQTA